MKTSRIAYEATGIAGLGKVAGTITVSSDLLKSDPVEITRQFLEKQYKTEVGENEVKAVVINEAA